MKKRIIKEVKGITLVALVVTIIVLLILSGVAISLSLGDDGIFKRAKEGAKTYQNASINEKIELDEVSNYIEDYLNGRKEETVITNVKEAIEKGTVYKENTVIYDEYNNPVKVPAGFKLAKDSGTDVTKGIVIEDVEAGNDDTIGNQYVWIPVGDVYINTNKDTKRINLGRYEFETNSDGVMKQSADNYTEVIEIDVNQEWTYRELTSGVENAIAKDLGDFITKTKNASGYYISRFEAGKVNENTNTFNIKKNQEVYNNITQENAADLARNLYINNDFQSDLINSYAYDTAIIYIQAFSGDSDYSKQIRFQDSLVTTGNAHDEENNYDVRCNIYDMAGSVREWSTETSSAIGFARVFRGGGYESQTGRYTSSRYGNNDMEAAEDYIGFRSILYV